MKNSYIFPALFHMGEDGISIEFPDLPGCLPCAKTLEEALRNSKEALALHLYGMEVDNNEIPEATALQMVKPGENEVVVPVEVFMAPLRDEMEMKTITTTITMPRWITRKAKEENLNISNLALMAIKQELGIAEYSSYYQQVKKQRKAAAKG